MPIQQLIFFYQKIQDDNRITTTHISLYMALFEFWNLNDFKNPIHISRRQIMPLSKISGIATYHKCIKDLQAYGYIRYTPSYHPAICSEVYMLNEV